jgi:ubiquinone biosynthesis protein COQ9
MTEMMEMDESTNEREQRRDALLLATLPHVAFEGWTGKAIAAGLADAGVSAAEGEIAFPGGVPEMIEHWSAWSEKRTFAVTERAGAGGLTATERLAMAVRTRIEVNIPYREAVRRTLAFLALPTNTALAARLSWRTVDALWYAAGDTATNFSYYIRRAALGAVYAATVLYWLDDESEAFVDTWAFLDRRLAGLDRLMAIAPTFGSGRAFRPFESLFGRFWRPRAD